MWVSDCLKGYSDTQVKRVVTHDIYSDTQNLPPSRICAREASHKMGGNQMPKFLVEKRIRYPHFIVPPVVEVEAPKPSREILWFLSFGGFAR